jgi:hypothetical protein
LTKIWQIFVIFDKLLSIQIFLSTLCHFGQFSIIFCNLGYLDSDMFLSIRPLFSCSGPYLFIIFLEPLLRWLEKDNKGYHFSTSPSSCITSAYADDLAILSDTIQNIQPQITKL